MCKKQNINEKLPWPQPAGTPFLQIIFRQIMVTDVKATIIYADKHIICL